jgi:hypothetical protein
MTFILNNAPDGVSFFDTMSIADVRHVLADPRLPESFSICAVHDYPALAVITDDEACWYIGYIDLFDGRYHPREGGARDGMNPFWDEDGYPRAVYVDAPEMVSV